MATRFKRPNGHYWIQFADLKKSRKTLRLGKVNAKTADAIKAKVESLLSARLLNCLPDEETARWVASIPPLLAAKLAAVDLIDKRTATTIGELTEYCQQHLTGKSRTDQNEHRHARSHLASHFGSDRQLCTITPADAALFFLWLKDEEGSNLAPQTAGKRCEKAKRYFTIAVDKKWLPDNPFDGLKTKSKTPRDRDVDISSEVIERVLKESADPKFRLVVALARYAGMRCPSEPFCLTWDDFNWEAGTVTFDAPKTGWRTTPLFPELRPYLDDVYHSAPDKAKLVFEGWNVTGSALTGRLNRILKRLGEGTWLKPWQNMRATRETELTDRFPEHVVCAWLGNTPKVARESYLRVVKEHLARALAPEPVNHQRRSKRRSNLFLPLPTPGAKKTLKKGL